MIGRSTRELPPELRRPAVHADDLVPARADGGPVTFYARGSPSLVGEQHQQLRTACVDLHLGEWVAAGRTSVDDREYWACPWQRRA